MLQLFPRAMDLSGLRGNITLKLNPIRNILQDTIKGKGGKMSDIRQEKDNTQCQALFRRLLEPITPYELGVQMAKESVNKYFEIKR